MLDGASTAHLPLPYFHVPRHQEMVFIPRFEPGSSASNCIIGRQAAALTIVLRRLCCTHMCPAWVDHHWSNTTIKRMIWFCRTSCSVMIDPWWSRNIPGYHRKDNADPHMPAFSESRADVLHTVWRYRRPSHFANHQTKSPRLTFG